MYKVDEPNIISKLLPSSVGYFECYSDIVDQCIFEEEIEALGNKAVEKRIREFITGRCCAHRAIDALEFQGPWSCVWEV